MTFALAAQDTIVVVLDHEGRIVKVNRAAERLLCSSFEEMGNSLLWNHFAPEEAKVLETMVRDTITAQVPGRIESLVLTKDGSRRWILWSSSFLLDKMGKVEYVVVNGVDISVQKQAEEALSKVYNELKIQVEKRTEELAEMNRLLTDEIAERKRIDEALRKSEIKYRTVADNTYDWEWWRDSNGRFIYMSPSCKRITCREADEFIKDPGLLQKIIHPDDRRFFDNHISEVEQNIEPGEVEFRICQPDGSIRWLAHVCQAVLNENGHILGRRGSNRDITPEKQAREALQKSEQQLRNLSSQLMTVQETERRRISRELHDELGGSLAVLKLRLSFIKRNLQIEQKKLKDECQQNMEHIDDILESMHRLSRDLSPSILEDIGLIPALKRLIEKFAENYDLKVTFDIIEPHFLLPKDSYIMIYRIFQEALTNIGKHARAKNITFKIDKNDRTIIFSLEDDGRGFDVKSIEGKEASQRGLGLTTMKERARILGASFELSSECRKGTRITLSIPVHGGENL